MHFLGTVIGPETESEVDDALARWDENADVEPYVVEYREDLLERAREWASRRPTSTVPTRTRRSGASPSTRAPSLTRTATRCPPCRRMPSTTGTSLAAAGVARRPDLQGLTVDGLRARAGAYPAVVALLGGIAVSVHGGGYEEEPADPLADCAGCEKVWFVDFHD